MRNISKLACFIAFLLLYEESVEKSVEKSTGLLNIYFTKFISFNT